MTPPTDHILLNADDPAPPQATVIIAGLSEPAADRVAAVLREGGVPVRTDARGGLFAPRLPRVAQWLGKAGLSLDRVYKRSAITTFVKAGDAQSLRWTLHVPESANFLANGGLAYFRGPRLILLTRDPIAVAEGLDPSGSPFLYRLRQATQRVDLVLRLASKATCPVLLLSHVDVMRPGSGFARIVRTFCGLDAGEETAEDETGPAVSTDAEADGGLVLIPGSSRGQKTSATKTIIIGGPPRSGTSMVASALYAGGLPLGENLIPSTFENALHNALFRPQTKKGNWQAALRRPRYFRLLWDGFDIEAIKKLVVDRRRDGPVWGFKRPGIHDYIKDGGLKLLEGPSVIMSFRDPLPMAKRIAQAHGLKMPVALFWARREIVASLETACVCDVPLFLVSYDVARRDFPAFLDKLFAFCGLAVDRARYDEIAAFGKESGEKYLKQFAAPSVGEVTGLSNGVLRGWVSRRANGEGVTVDVFANDKKVGSVVADREQKHGRLGFRCRLDRRPLPESARITAFVAATKTELDYSGLTIAELRRGLVRLGNRAMSEEAESIG